ncbi:NUDIX domain-containing protein [Nonomuraea sp. MCN248]|uniref:NUDIX domain-containing protein n=1 Tax=Nonomuraea corallina TaxID=2989783 RepID=A0ABT4S587_9ACTN|nr:ADP-ribosyltransferase [Nonomuraea corallina]MDA0632357.1 NUDIX domain-containing protein [Nonomuraea corallina]
MGFDGSLVPDWAKPYVDYTIDMDWPESDENDCFRLADACAATARTILNDQGITVHTRPGDDWNGDALEQFLQHVQDVSDPALRTLVERLVTAALQYNDLGVQVQNTKRMIEVSVWFMISQLAWLLATTGPWGPLSLSLTDSRVQVTRLAIAQLRKRLLTDIALFDGPTAGPDPAAQEAAREELDWEQIMRAGGTGDLLGEFLTAFNGLMPPEGPVGRPGPVGGATDLITPTGGDPPDRDPATDDGSPGLPQHPGGPYPAVPFWLTPGAPAPAPTRRGSAAPGRPSLPRGYAAAVPWPDAEDATPVRPRTSPGPGSIDALLNAPRPAGHAQPAGRPPGPFRVLGNPGLPGDGHVIGAQGRYGAAGVLIRSVDGVARHLLVQQAEAASDAGTWRLPGGALHSREQPVNAAARELSGTLGVDQSRLDELRLRGSHPVQPYGTGWTYTHLAAEGPLFTPRLDSSEIRDARWFTLDELDRLANRGRLHPVLAEALPDVLALFHGERGLTATPAHRSGPVRSGLVPHGPDPSLSRTVHRTASGSFYVAAAPHVPLDAPFGARTVSPSFGEAVWSPVVAELSPAELAAVRGYAGSGHRGINRYLRRADPGRPGSVSLPAPRASRLRARIQALDEVLRRRPVPESIDVFRRLHFRSRPFTVPVEHLPGTVQRDPAFLPTTIGDRAVGGHAVMLCLRVPAGTPAFYLPLLSGSSGQELLLGSGLSWYVEDVLRKDGRWHVYGWVLPPEDSGG